MKPEPIAPQPSEAQPIQPQQHTPLQAQPVDPIRAQSAPTDPVVIPSPAPPSPAAPPPPIVRVEEVEAVRVTRAETRGPTIEVPGVARTPEPTPPPAAAPAASSSTSGPAFQQASSSVPPPAGQPPPPPIPPAPPAAPAAPRWQGFWVLVCHLAYLIPGYIPGLVLTLLIWAWRRRRDPLLDDQAKEAINFQLMYAGISLILVSTCLLCVLVPVLWIVGAVLCVVAAVNAADGKRYRYPYLFRLIT